MKKKLSNEARAKLKFVNVGSGDVDISKFPNFLIVGPQRTGTSWLFSNLRTHPEIMMPHFKEILFFNRLKNPGSKKFQSNELAWYLDRFDEPMPRYLAKSFSCLRTYRRFYKPRLRGEASASYAALDRDVISEILAINPDIKVILMIRDPIERAWSHAVKDLARDRQRALDEVPDAEFEEFFCRPYQMRCASYVENYENWVEALKPGHVFVGDYQFVSARPDKLIHDIMKFVGVTNSAAPTSDLSHKVVNPSGAKKVPDRWRAHLLDLLGEKRQSAQDYFSMQWANPGNF